MSIETSENINFHEEGAIQEPEKIQVLENMLDEIRNQINECKEQLIRYKAKMDNQRKQMDSAIN